MNLDEITEAELRSDLGDAQELATTFTDAGSKTAIERIISIIRAELLRRLIATYLR